MMRFFVIFLLLITCSQAREVKLRWHPNPEDNIGGYRLHYSENVDGAWGTTIDVGNVTKGTVDGLDEDTVYYFTVTAYNTQGLESIPSESVPSHPKLDTIPAPVATTVIKGDFEIDGKWLSHYNPTARAREITVYFTTNGDDQLIDFYYVWGLTREDDGVEAWSLLGKTESGTGSVREIKGTVLESEETEILAVSISAINFFGYSSQRGTALQYQQGGDNPPSKVQNLTITVLSDEQQDP